jgi:proline iminopeptidase
MAQLYPLIEPYNTGFLSVSQIHSLYYEECGNPAGVPAVMLHGGPGSGCSDEMRQMFDPKYYRIILFDQRGAKRSTPHASLEDNTTWHLVDDIEKLRAHLGIEKWLVFGGSWGSTLSLSYSQKYPERVSHLILRGIFLGRDEDNKWLYEYGASELFPEKWDEFIKGVTPNPGESYIDAYYRVLTGVEEKPQLEAARRWSNWEFSIIKLVNEDKPLDDESALSFARIECHYIKNNCFLEEGQLLTDAHKIAHIPMTIVHGRYDVICSMRNAWELKRVLPHANLVVTPRAGHSMFDAENAEALVDATNGYRAAE